MNSHSQEQSLALRLPESMSLGRALHPAGTNVAFPKQPVVVPYRGIGCGHSVAARAATSGLDLAVLSYCSYRTRQQRTQSRFLDLGCGDGRLGVSLHAQGASVTLVDRVDVRCLTARQLCDKGVMQAIIKPAEFLYPREIPRGLEGLVAQRFLHWLPYKQARGLLKRVRDNMKPGAKLFLSVAGFDCPLANGYPHTARTPIEQRYGPTRTGEDFIFGHNATLYTPSEIIDLLDRTGFDSPRIQQTTWGLWNVTALRSAARLG